MTERIVRNMYVTVKDNGFIIDLDTISDKEKDVVQTALCASEGKVAVWQTGNNKVVIRKHVKKEPVRAEPFNHSAALPLIKQRRSVPSPVHIPLKGRKPRVSGFIGYDTIPNPISEYIMEISSKMQFCSVMATQNICNGKTPDTIKFEYITFKQVSQPIHNAQISILLKPSNN